MREAKKWGMGYQQVDYVRCTMKEKERMNTGVEQYICLYFEQWEDFGAMVIASIYYTGCLGFQRN
jgi:hypothetical protein